VARGWCKLESLYDGSLTLVMLAEANDAIDVMDENEMRLRTAERREQRG
jgi:Family of unknown function (DUF6889)